MRWKVEQNRHLARMRQAARQASRLWKLPLILWKVHLARQASRQASRLWKLPLMQWKVEQNRHLARMAGLEAMEIGTDAMESGAKQTLG